MENTNLPANELVFIRELNAPRELVFDVWTHSEHLAKWWGPNGFSITTPNMEAQTGGSWEFTMHGPDGRNYPNKINFTEVIRPEKLIYKHSGDADTEDVSFEVRIHFEDLGNKTKLTMNMIFESAQELQRVAKEYGAIEGAEQHLGRLNQYLQTLQHHKS
jgi:uncharacterized protein YndB with AHSA1/START domain